MTFSNNINRDQAPRNVGPDLRSILFKPSVTFYWKQAVRISLDELNSENKEIILSLQIVQELLEGTVFAGRCL